MDGRGDGLAGLARRLLDNPARFAASLLNHDELVKCHFDDLTSVPQIKLMKPRTARLAIS